MKSYRWTRKRKRVFATSLTSLFAVAFGWVLWQLNVGESLRLASYDIPFLFGEKEPPPELAVVYLDDATYLELEQPVAQPWDRRIHADLVNVLNEMGAEVIVFDILFSDSRPEEDSLLADAIKAHGKVILAGELSRSETSNGIQESLLLATPDLRVESFGWGHTEMIVDVDGEVRRIRHGMETPFGLKPSLAEEVRIAVEGQPTKLTNEISNLNYYGPPQTITGYSYGDVLAQRGIPEGAFQDKVVFIGMKQKSGTAASGKDVFPTPYTRITKQLSTGVEVHATAAGNLLQNDEIERWSDGAHAVLIFGCALAMSLAACLLAPARGIPLCFGVGLLVLLAGVIIHRQIGEYFYWTVISFGQMPLVIGCALGTHYLIEYSARWKLRRAFKSYMSEEQARLLDEDSDILELGGKEVETTVFFSDLEGFTSMSEGLPPQSVSKALISYFELATEGILDQQGTIIKYVGDAVMATWGTPLKVEREADRAIEAAIQMQIAGKDPITLETADGKTEKVLHTRIGINTGLGLAGNLGSRRRFDYTIIGDTTNLAARLEGLNKMLGTSILVAESVLKKCEEPEKFATRRMGCYVVKGRSQAVVVYEVFGYADDLSQSIRERSVEYLQNYAAGVKAFEAGDLRESKSYFQQSLMLHDRDAEDKATGLFLSAIEDWEESGSAMEDWRGAIVLASK